MSEDGFDNADFYGSTHDERLTHETPEEYLDDYLNNAGMLGESIEKVIEAEAPVTVTAYKREEVTGKWVAWQAESLLDSFEESFGEEYGDPEGESSGDFEGERAIRASHIAEALWKIVKQGRVWRCREVGSREYTAEELREIVK